LTASVRPSEALDEDPLEDHILANADAQAARLRSASEVLDALEAAEG
jgi:hypothetical protein